MKFGTANQNNSMYKQSFMGHLEVLGLHSHKAKHGAGFNTKEGGHKYYLRARGKGKQQG